MTFGVPGVSESFSKVGFDAAGNLYVGGSSGSDLVVASFKPNSTLRWSTITDGGFSQNDEALGLVVQNNNVQLCYRSSPAAAGIESYGQQVINKESGALGTQSTISPTSDTFVHGVSHLQDVSTIVGNLPGLAQSFIVRFSGSAPPTYTAISTNGPLYNDVLQNPAGTYIAGIDALGGFVMKWDPVANMMTWRSNMPVGFVPERMAVGGSGDLFIAGSIYVTSQDIGVVRLANTGMPLGYGTFDSGPGFDDLITNLAVAGSCPVVVGTRQDAAGNRVLQSVFFQSSLMTSNTYTDPASTTARSIVSDGTNVYVSGTDWAGGDDRLYKLSSTGLLWWTILNRTVNREVVNHLGFRGTTLAAVGSDGGADAFIDSINPATGAVIW